MERTANTLCKGDFAKMKGSTKKTLRRVFFSIISIVLCISIVSTSSVVAYASVEYDEKQKDNVLRFNSVDDIATDEVCLIVFGDMTQLGADSEGRAIIGGDLTIEQGWSASVKAKFNNDYALIVGGDLTADGWLSVGGCAAIPADHVWNAKSGWDTQGMCQHCSSQCSYCQSCYKNHLPGTACSTGHYSNQHMHVDTTGWIDAYVNSAEIAFKSASAQYAARPNDGNIAISGSTATLSPSADHVAGNPHVFNIDGNAITAVNFDGSFGSDSILINISGTKPNVYGGNDSDTVRQAQAVWNYYEATALESNSTSVQGSLLAPYATYTAGQGHVNGTTIVQNMVATGGFEYHTGNFFKDPLKATLTVEKKMSDGSTPDADFGFTLYHKEGSGWTEIESFTLKAGEVKAFNDLPEGNTYKVVETDSGTGYGFVSVTGGTTNDNASKSATFTVAATGYKVVFTNEAQTGSITVKKALEDAIDPSASFSFTLQKQNGSTWENVAGATFNLTNNGSKTIEGLEYGNYRVVEDVSGSVYTTTVGGETGNAAQIALTADNANQTVTFTNTRKEAKLTVVKTIAAGDKDTGESFTFQLFEAKNGAWEKKDAEFSLKNGESKTFTLPVGVEYKVEEISSGSSYTLTGVSPSNEVKLTSDYTMTFTNSIARMGITVTKEVIGGGNASDVFTFNISGRELNENFTLKAGESKTFDNLQEGDSYVIKEVESGAIYELDSIVGGTVEGNKTTVVVAQGASVTFKNKVKTGEITIGKTLADTVNPEATFTFTVKDAAGTVIKTVTLANGETATVSGLPYGQTYTVEEATDGVSYVTTYSVDGKAAVSGTSTNVTIGGSHSVNFTNKRASTTLTVVKKLADGSINLGETYTFQLYKNVKGSWFAQGDPFTLTAGASTSFSVDIGAEYGVVELSSGDSYKLSTVTGGTSVEIDGAAGASKVIAGNTTFTFVNEVKKGSIYVYKKLNDNVATDASFTFTLQKYEGGTWKDVEMIAFGNEEGYEFKGLDYGYNYRVVETVDSSIYSTVYNVYADATLSGGKLNVSGSSDSGASNVSAEIKLDSQFKAIVFTNTRKTATLKVSKALVAGSADLGEDFTFQIERQLDGKWTKVGSAFTLKAGDKPYSVELEVGVNYRVIETSTGASYSFSSVAGANAIDGVNGGQIKFTKDTEVTIYNKIKTGEITVTKVLNDTTSPDAKFTFTLYKKSGSGWISTGETFLLGKGESLTIKDLPYGETYKLVETGSDLYATSNTVAGVETASNETPEITISKATVEVEFENTRKTATLTVDKKLKDGSYNFGDTFEFVLERKLADDSWTKVEEFTLKAGEKTTFKLAVGETYRVIETGISDNYDFYTVEGDGSYIVAENGKGASIAFAADASVTIVNKTKGASLTVRKSVSGTGAAEDTFSFKLQKLVGDKWTDVESFDLKAGGSKDFDVQLGDSYRVYETKYGASYELTGITGGDENVVESAYAQVTIDGAEDITFVNTVKKGSVIVTKTLNDDLNSDAKFAFTVQAQIDGEWKTIGNGLIGGGESFTVGGIEYGTLVRVIEAVDSAKYATVNNTGDGAQAELTISGDAEINFTNTRKNATIKVAKQLSAGSSDVGDTFAFELFVKNGSAWTSVEKFSLKAGESKTFDKLYAGADYMVVETLADGSKYIFDTVSGGSFAEYKNNPAATVTASADAAANVVFYNANAAAKLQVAKTVVGDAGEDSFSFELQKKEGATYTTVDTFVLKAGETKTLDVVYGSTYRVVETKLGDIYKLTAIDGADTNSIANRTADVRIVTGTEKITFTNTVKSATLVVDKALAAGSKDLGETFTFELLVKEGTAWKSVEEFTLSAGGKQEFTDLVAGKEYLVVEKLGTSSKYNFVSVTGATYTEYKNNNGGAVVLLPDVANNVTFTNMVKGASLTINKSVVGDAKADTFTFDIYKKNGTEYVAFKKGVVVTPGTPVTITEGVSIGDEFKIVESGAASRFELTAIAGADNSSLADNAAFVKIPAEGSNVTFTNTVRSATLKVSKALAEGSNNLGGTFAFELYRLVDGNWEYEKSFELGIGKSVTFTDLIAGEQYLVIEKLADGSVYAFASVAGGKAETFNGYNGASIAADADKAAAIEFTNKNAEASLTVKKVVAGTANDNVFAFKLQKKNGTEYVDVEEFNLTAGQTKTFTVKFGDQYRVIETAVSGRYTLTAITGADEIDIADKYGDVTIDGAEVVTFTNTVNTGSLTVSKTVVEDIDSGASFTFQLMKWNGTEFVNDGDAFQLANGEKKTFEGLEYGSVYVVKETANDSYTTKYKVGSDAEAAGLEAAYTVNAKAQSIKFTNTRKQATLTVDKAIVGADNGYEFTFQLQQKDGDGWKNVGSAFKLSATAEPKSFQLDVDTKYRVIETDTGATYNFASADVAGASDEIVITDKGNKGVEFTLIGNADVTITNEIKTTKLTLSKRVDGFANGDSFTFTVSKNGGEAVTYTLKAGEFVEIDADYEDVFVITEGALSDRYELSGIVGADSTEGMQATITINADDEAVEYTNKVKTGEIIITKTLNDVANPDAKFVFTAEYSTDGNTWQPLSDSTNSSSKSLGNGEQWKITGIQYGTQVRITESVDGKLYTTTNTVGSSSTAIVTIDAASETVGFTNTRNNTKLSVYKQLKAGDVNTGDEFKFTLNGPNYDNYEFTLKITEGTTTNVVTFDKILVGADYTITETDSGKSYSLYSVEADGKNIENGASINIVDAMSVVFTNTVKAGELTVKKELNDVINPDASFEVTATITDAEGNVTTQSGVISARTSKTFTGIPFGSTVVVTETVDSDIYTTTYKVGETETNTVAINSEKNEMVITNTRKNASLTVVKTLAAGGTDVAGDFEFELLMANGTDANGNTVWKSVENFTLKLGESKTFADLYTGVEYLVIEKLAEGSKYVFSSVAGGTELVYDGSNGAYVMADAAAAKTLTFTNDNAGAKLTVGKEVVGKSYGDTFTFQLQKLTNGAYVNVGDEIVLAAGETQDIAVKYGDSYRIVETKLGAKYSLTAIEGADNFALENRSADIKIDSAEQTVIFTNTVKSASLTINKKLAAGSNNLGGTFAFDIYSITTDENGNEVVTLYKTVKLEIGGSETINGLVAGERYYVIERLDDATAYDFYQVEGAELVVYDGNKGGVIELQPDVANTVTISNTAKSAKLIINKAVIGEARTDTFTFDVYKMVGGQYTKIREAMVVVPGTPVEIEANVGDKFMIVETSSAARFELTAIDGADTKDLTKLTAEVTVPETGSNVTFTNSVKATSITVSKKLADGGVNLGDNAKFDFALYHRTADGDVLVESFQLELGGKKTINGLVAGDEYIVVEKLAADSKYTFVTVTGGEQITYSDYDAVKLTAQPDAANAVEFTNGNAGAKLTIKKMVSAHGMTCNDTFTFQLQKKVGDKYENVGEVITLAAGAYVNVDVKFGDVYRIIETNLGASYDLVAVNGADTVDLKEYAAVVTINDANETVEFNNCLKKGSVTVTKTLDDDYTPNAKFVFKAEKLEGENWVALNDASGRNSVEISDNGSWTITNIPYGTQVRITESAGDGKTYTTTNTVGEGNTAVVTVNGENAEIGFTNTRNSANLSVQKTLTGLMDADEEFIITVTGVFKGSQLEQTKTYYFAATAAEATETTEARYAIGTIVPVEGVLYGATYVIEEKTGDVNYYDTSVNGVLGTTGKVTVYEDTNIVVDNPRKTADLTVTKSLEAGSEDLGEEFAFQLFRLRSGEWEKVGEQFVLKAGESYTFTGIPVGFTYKVIETETGADYLFGSVPEDTILVNGEEGMGAMFVLSKDRTVNITNRLNPYSITVRKTVSADGGDANAEFTFELQKKNGSKWETVEEFTLKANGDKLFKNLAEGDVYRVVETDTGAAYDFDNVTIRKMGDEDSVDNNKCAAIVTVDGAEDITFHNVPKTQTLKVTKEVTGTEDASAKFKFELWKNTGDGWTFEKDFNLSAGKTEKIDVIYGVEYKVVESATGASYELKKIDGADSYDLAKASGTVTVDGDEEIIFTNALATGTITVTKTVTGYDTSNRAFSFQLVDQDGYAVAADGTNASGKFSLRNGESVTLSGIPCGTIVYVVETVDAEEYQTSYTVDGSDYYSGNMTSTVVIGPDNSSISYLNNYIGSVVLGAESSVDLESTTTKPTVNETPTIKVESSPVINKVLGDYDTPTTGDGDIPMPIIIAMAVSVIIILSIGKKKKSGVGVR
ncbi:MAG: choice-of-anchor A family protein [Ruminococcaceae bacterium]|nr:choice-of-anchor A family protein [Oscillospiraceae bacterium]